MMEDGMILYELNPCPKCGDDESQYVYDDGARPDDGYRLIICRNCLHESPWGKSLDEAVDIWNAQEPDNRAALGADARE
jgi:hypothetical protein